MYFCVEKIFVVVVVVRYDLRLNVTFCLVWFVQKIQETKGFQKRLNTSLHVVLNSSNSIPIGYKLKLVNENNDTRQCNIKGFLFTYCFPSFLFLRAEEI